MVSDHIFPSTSAPSITLILFPTTSARIHTHISLRHHHSTVIALFQLFIPPLTLTQAVTTFPVFPLCGPACGLPYSPVRYRYSDTSQSPRPPALRRPSSGSLATSAPWEYPRPGAERRPPGPLPRRPSFRERAQAPREKGPWHPDNFVPAPSLRSQARAYSLYREQLKREQEAERAAHRASVSQPTSRRPSISTPRRARTTTAQPPAEPSFYTRDDRDAQGNQAREAGVRTSYTGEDGQSDPAPHGGQGQRRLFGKHKGKGAR